MKPKGGDFQSMHKSLFYPPALNDGKDPFGVQQFCDEGLGVWLPESVLPAADHSPTNGPARVNLTQNIQKIQNTYPGR